MILLIGHVASGARMDGSSNSLDQTNIEYDKNGNANANGNFFVKVYIIESSSFHACHAIVS
jgi:hypothetical protein